MKTHQTAARIIAGVLPAMALFATPALAQDTINTTTAPPPAPAAAAPAASEPAAATPATGPSAEDQSRYQASLDAATRKPATVAASTAERTRTAARPTARSAAPRAQTTAPVAATPVAPAATAAAPPPVTQPSPAPVEAVAPAAPAEPAATTTQTTTQQPAGTPAWMWLVAALAGLGVIVLGVLALRRRQSRDEWVEGEPAYVEAAPTAVAAEPFAHDEPVVEHADVVTAEADDIAAMTDAAAPVAGRPWIELSLRPVRAGATDESALVDLELTLANAGEVGAKDVRVSTFMLGDATDAPTDMERLLARSHTGTEVDAGAIDAGEGSRIDARVAVPRDGLEGATFQPLVGVDVRYTLPNGSEGRTAAAFTVGVHDDTDTPTPLRLGGDMREDVSATLHGVPERV